MPSARSFDPATITAHGRWPAVAAGLAPATTVVWLVARRRLDASDRWAAAAMSVLTWHQFEEWVWPGGFYEWLNEDVFGSVERDRPLDPRIGFLVNVPFGWGISVAATVAGERVAAIPIALCVSHLGNAALHLGWAARHRRWDPGAVTAATILVPYAVVGLRRRIGRDKAPATHQAVGIAAGALSAVGLFATLRCRMR